MDLFNAIEFVHERCGIEDPLETYKAGVFDGFQFHNGYCFFSKAENNNKVAWIDAATNGKGFLRHEVFVKECARMREHGYYYVATFAKNNIAKRYLEKCKFQRVGTDKKSGDPVYALKLTI